MSFSITSPLLLTNLTWPSLVLMVIISVLTLYFCFCLSLCLNLSRKLPLSKSLARLLNAMMMSMIVLSRVSDHMFWCDTVLTGPSAQLSVNSNRAGFTSDWHKIMVRVYTKAQKTVSHSWHFLQSKLLMFFRSDNSDKCRWCLNVRCQGA